MPSVTYNGQSFAIDGRRIWMLGASLQYARIPAPLWAARIRAARQAGFNTIETACPWSIHEPRRGRYVFDGDADLRGFIGLCGEAGLRVVLRAGPYIGAQFDSGGLPGWLGDLPGIALREANEVLLENASRYLRKLVNEISDLQATSGGPILLVQSEHAWTCANEMQAEKYLHEITRFIRESGITVPIINANDLWQESRGTIDTWRGYEDLLAHARQLRSLQPAAPVIVSQFDATEVEIWGAGGGGRARTRAPGADAPARASSEVVSRLAEVLAAGGQAIVAPFHAGTNFGFLAGRIAGREDAFVTTRGAIESPLGEAGERGELYHAIRRLTTFANHFGHVFAELDPGYHPVVIDPERAGIEGSGHQARADTAAKRRSRSLAAATPTPISVAPLRGPLGRIIFLFSPVEGASASIILDDGIRLPVSLGDQRVGWYVMEVDLGGLGRLDFANLCPWGVIGRSIIVFHGPAKSAAYLSISGTPLEATVPAEGAPPLVLEDRGLTIVICNQAQIDRAYHDDDAVYVGVDGLDAQGRPLAAQDFPTAWSIRTGAKVEMIAFDAAGTAVTAGSSAGARGKRKSAARAAPHRKHAPAPIKLGEWQAAPSDAYAAGRSPRFASLDGPASLSDCGAPNGYGWYRLRMEISGRRLCHVPQGGDRLHLFIDGKRQRIIGVGRGASRDPFEIRFTKEGQNLVFLADNLGRFSEGNDMGLRSGLYGHMYEVRVMRGRKPKFANAKPVNPFALRGFISGLAAGELTHTRQAIWTFNHTKKTPILVDVSSSATSGVFVLNDQPVSYFAGAGGACTASILLDPRQLKPFKRGRNVLRFAPDHQPGNEVEETAKATSLYECVSTPSESATWSFAKWEPPGAAAFVSRADLKHMRGVPCWWRTTFPTPADLPADRDAPLWIETAGLSKGQAFVNGRNLGRYFTATADARPVGPQTRLYLPACWLQGEAGPNEVVIFDEHGFEPARVKIIA